MSTHPAPTRTLVAIPLAAIMLLVAVAPVAGVDPSKMGGDAQPGDVQSEPTGSGEPGADGGSGTGVTTLPTDDAGRIVVSDELLRLHQAKGAPVNARDPL